LILAKLEDLQNVRMGELSQRFGFTLEPAQPVGIFRHLGWQDLDRNIPIEPLILRAVDYPHPTLADFLNEAVVPEGATDEVTHCGNSQREYGNA
jgi:hypothetical protein